MNPLRLLVAAVLITAVSGPVGAAQARGRRDVWEVQFDNGGIVDLRLLCEGGKVAAGFAPESDRNVPWFADV